MENTQSNKILVGIIFCLLFFVSLQRCKSTNTSSKVKTTFKTDTTYVTHIDTIPFYNLKDSIRWYNLPITSISISSDSSEFAYSTLMEDSLIGGVINTIVKSDGTLIQQDFTYVPKFPKYIYRTDSIIVNNTITNTIIKKELGLYGGLMISPYKNLAMVGTLGIQTKKDMYFGVGYDPFNSNVFLDIKMKLFIKKN